MVTGPRIPTAYDVVRVVGLPRQLWRRRQERGNSAFAIALLESSRYRKAAYDFIAARMADPGLLHDFDLSTDDIAVDVGAFKGNWTTAILDRHGCRVEAFELSPDYFEGLRQLAHKRSRVTVHEYGLGAVDQAVDVWRRDMGSSTYASPEDGDTMEIIEGRIRDVAAVWSELGWQRVAVMKLNIEGGEYDLLDRMIQRGLLERVDTFIIQFHEWIPGAYRRRRRIRRELARSHRQVWNYPFVWEKWQRRAD